MSVVVALKKNGIVYLGADSQVTRGGTRSSLSNPNNFKIWKVRNVEHCLMGCVGYFRDGCAVRVMDDLVGELDVLHDIIDYEYVVRRIEPAIRDELIEHSFVERSNPYRDMHSDFLFVYRDSMYTISGGSVIEHDDFVAMGSAESEAIGSLLTTGEDMDPNERIIRAIKAGAAHDIYVDYPIVLINSEEMEFRVISETQDRESPDRT